MAPINQPTTTESDGTLLVVDLDGTLSRTDILFESIVLLAKRQPHLLLLLPLWLLRGKAHLKHKVAASVQPDVTSLPYHRPFLAFLREQHSLGRPLVLMTATHESIARRVAAHLGIFASAFGSTDNLNLCGPRKLELIMQRFPEAPFDYAANSHDDVPVLSRARHAVLVNPARGLKRRVSNVSCTFDDRRGFLRSLTRAMRPYQWAKNVLVFVPLFTAHLWLDARALATGLLGFVSLSLAASSVYLLNDLLDIEADRAHPRKKSRPLAAGDMSVVAAGLAVIALSGASITMAAFLSRPFLPILLLYLASTSLYSFFLKRFVLLDVIMLAGLYTLRVIAGAAAVAVEVSFWLLAFSMFVFLSLALVKRCAELQLLAAQDGMAAAGRDYRTTDLGTLRIVGVGCGLLAVLVVALYIHSPDMSGLYTSPHTLWLLCPLILYWICRVWLKTERGEMHDDPIVFAVKDKTSYLVGLCTVLVVVLATFAPPLFFL